MDRVVLGKHANNDLGFGLYVSKPGANVMHPEHAQAGNLVFDSSQSHSTLNIIQTGNFKITCSRQSISPRGQTIGNRPNVDTFQRRLTDWGSLNIGSYTGLFDDTGVNADPAIPGMIHTFKSDTGRPSGLTTSTDPNLGTEDLAQFDFPFASNASKSKQGNYLDKGTHTITIGTPLPNGEIPEVALRFAVGNSSGHFHPWYADVTATGSKGNWDEWTYNNSKKIVHMDSNWVRLKWGGLGAESYRGVQDDYDYDSLVKYLDLTSIGGDDGETRLLQKFGFSSTAEAKEKINTNSKLLSLAITNAQGVVGLVPYVSSDSITIDAYMTPTHAGLRQPIDRTFDLNAGRQKGVGFNAIDDYAHINFPMESHPHTSGLTDDQIRNDLHAVKYKHLPGIPHKAGTNYDKMFSLLDPMLPFMKEDQGKRDMYGWGGHPTEFFVNPFSNGNCTFYTHMQPPYLVPAQSGSIPPASRDPAYYSLTEPRGYRGVGGMAWPGTYMPVSLLGPHGDNWGTYYANESGRWGPYITAWANRAFSEAENENMWLGLAPWNSGAYTVGDPVTVQATAGDTSKNGDPIGTASTPSRSVFNGAGIKWPAGHYHADYLDYRDWTGSMGLDGAGSKESLAKEDVWDTFYVSYVVYSTGSEIPTELFPDTVIGKTDDGSSSELDPRSYVFNIPSDLSADGLKKGIDWNDWWSGDLISPGFGGANPDYNEGGPSATNGPVNVYWNLVFPDDFVGEIGNAGTDPFHDRRDFAGKIIGNVDITFNVPNNVYIGSREGSSILKRPKPALHLDFSDAKWNRINNKDASVTLVNSGIIMGGAGSGGFGGRDASVVQLSGGKGAGGPSSSQTRASRGGGGGGAGGGTGRDSDFLLTSTLTQTAADALEPIPVYSIIGNHEQVGFSGKGWGSTYDGWSPHLDETLVQGADGVMGYDFWYAGPPGAMAPFTVNYLGLDVSDELISGGDGGDAIFVSCDPLNPISLNLISYMKDITNPSQATWIVGGGGGGAGGFEQNGSSGGHSGMSGFRGNIRQLNSTTSGGGLTTLYHDPLERDQLPGGDPGYIVGSLNNSFIVPTRLYCISESGNLDETAGWHGFKGKNPDVPDHTSHTIQSGSSGQLNGTNNDFVFQGGFVSGSPLLAANSVGQYRS